MTERITARRRAAGISALLLAGVLIYGLSLRSPITAVAPVIGDIATDLSLSPAKAGLLTGLPVLCFAVLTPFAALLLGRIGPATTVTLSLTAVLTGTIVRSVGGFTTALIGTVIIGGAIALGNLAVPVIVSRDFASAAASVTGLYTASLNTGSVLTTVLTAPWASVVGWRWALATWAVIPAAGSVVWFFARTRLRDAAAPPSTAGAASVAPPSDTTSTAPPHPASTSRVTRDRRAHSTVRLTVLLSIAFSGQAFGYYAVTAWLPSLLADKIGFSQEGAGGAASLFQLFAIAGGIAVPVALARKVRIRLVTMAMAACWITLPVGLTLAPSVWPLWCSLAGLAQGGAFTVIFTLVALRTPGAREARRVAAIVQTIGYGFAALGPIVTGAVHAATSGWTVPMLVIGTGLALMATTLTIAARESHS